MLVKFPCNYLIARLNDQFRLVGGQFAEVFVDEGRGLLKDAKRANHLARHAVVADVEVMQTIVEFERPSTGRRALQSRPSSQFLFGFLEVIRWNLQSWS